jgi:phosphoribosylanthranilate isomerase
MKVKICGLTSLEDALQAAEAGADLLGFNFYPPSPRYLTANQCNRIIAGLQEHGVHNDRRRLRQYLPGNRQHPDDCGLDLAQLSGDEPQKTYRRWANGVQSPAFRQSPTSRRPSTITGHGKTARLPGRRLPGGEYGAPTDCRLALAAAFPESSPFAGGGLTPANVRAIAQVQPWGVDVASG